MQKKAKIKNGDNQLTISLSDHTFVDVSTEAGEWMATEKTTADKVFINLPPGDYVIETDGKIKSAKSELCEFELDLGKEEE